MIFILRPYIVDLRLRCVYGRGDRYFNIVGVEVVIPENGAVKKAQAAADILWCAAPFGRYHIIDWGEIFEEEIADYYALQAKRLDIKLVRQLRV